VVATAAGIKGILSERCERGTREFAVRAEATEYSEKEGDARRTRRSRMIADARSGSPVSDVYDVYVGTAKFLADY